MPKAKCSLFDLARPLAVTKVKSFQFSALVMQIFQVGPGSSPDLEFIHLATPDRAMQKILGDSRKAAASLQTCPNQVKLELVCPVRAATQSPGLAALFAANPGET